MSNACLHPVHLRFALNLEPFLGVGHFQGSKISGCVRPAKQNVFKFQVVKHNRHMRSVDFDERVVLHRVDLMAQSDYDENQSLSMSVGTQP